MIAILLVDGHEMIRKAVQALTEKSDDLQVVVTVSMPFDAVAQARSGCRNTIWSVFFPLLTIPLLGGPFKIIKCGFIGIESEIYHFPSIRAQFIQVLV
jgi:hypothetical protein